jgi:hypothetical protein
MITPLTSSTWRSFSRGIVVFLLTLTGCLNSLVASRIMYEDPTLLVRLDSPSSRAEVLGAPDQHVAELTTVDLASVLRSVMIQPETSFVSYWILRKDPQPKPAFPDSDADLLATHLRDALAKIRPNETAVFFLRRVREDGIPLVTTGGLIVRGDQLIVLLANARRPITTQRTLDAAREAPLIPLEEPGFHIVPGPYQTSIATKDLPKFMAMKSFVPALSVNYLALLNDFAQPNRSSPAPGAGAEVPAATMDEKLHRLKTWREQGLITDDDYRDKRQELLKQF